MIINPTVGKTLRTFALKHESQINEVDSDEDGHWIFLESGWRMQDDLQHIYHADSVAELIQWFRSNPPVVCEHCKVS